VQKLTNSQELETLKNSDIEPTLDTCSFESIRVLVTPLVLQELKL
jgi:hypothetical protein